MKSEIRILVAEDDPRMLGVFSDILTQMGYSPLLMQDGNQALAAIQDNEFHLAIFDLFLPGPTGLELLAKLKNISPDTEVIIITGSAHLESALQALRLGAYDYLLKSELRLAPLRTVITRALERRRLTLANRGLTDDLKRAQEELAQRRSAELSQIRRLGEVLAGPLTWQQLLNGLTSLIWDSLSLSVLGLELRGRGEHLPLHAYRRHTDAPEATFTAFQQWLQAELEHLRDTRPDFSSGPQPLPSLLSYPLDAGQVVGMVAAGRQTAFSLEEAEIFHILALMGEAAVKNLAYLEQVKNLAIRDALTGLYNFRCFWEILPREVEQSRRYGTPLSLIFLDIDNFKRINDTKGHAAGNAVLKTLAAYLRDAVRQADLLCRYGGEEFVVLLSQTTLEDAARLAERLRLGVAQTPVPLPAAELKVTVSLGVAGLKPEMDGEALVKAADAALYRAKESGKNRVVIAER